MNILYEQFPEEVKVNGEYYPIVTDFREWIRFTELVEDDSVPWRMKCGLLLQWYLDQIPDAHQTMDLSQKTASEVLRWLKS